jgi:hypothetical protein
LALAHLDADKKQSLEGQNHHSIPLQGIGLRNSLWHFLLEFIPGVTAIQSVKIRPLPVLLIISRIDLWESRMVI